MLRRFKKDYFGVTLNAGTNPEIYIQNDLPKIVQKSVLAHEMAHVENEGTGTELQAWVAGFKAQPIGWLLGIILSLRWSRIKMYPILSASILVAFIFMVAYFS